MNENNFKVKYCKNSKGAIRREIPKICMSKKERLRKRLEGIENERFKNTGRGNANVDEVERVKEYLRETFPKTARKMDIAKSIGLGQDRILIILNLLSGVSEDNQDNDTEFAPKDFLVYEDENGENTRYGIFADIKTGIKNGIKITQEGKNE
jgi:hypothetical protein